MAYLLDTNICIYVIKRKPIAVLEKLNSIRPSEIGLSIITVAELYFGAQKSSNPEKNLSALNRFLIPLNIFDFDSAAAIQYSSIRAELETKGLPIGPLDTLIAAHAKSLDYVLVTNNEKEFERVRGLKIENWTK